MHDSPWQRIVGNLISDRLPKPRNVGVTMVIDTGIGQMQVHDILALSGQCIDHWKFAFGTSVFYNKSVLFDKLALLAEYKILTMPGGTLLEVALIEHHCRKFMRQAKSLGFTAVEISDGTIPMPDFRRKNIIHCALDNGLLAVTEVGKKDPRKQPTPEEVAEQALIDLQNGASWVVMEGRESGRAVGIYGQYGEVIDEYVGTIIGIMGDYANRVIWEAPQKDQQAYLINKLGTNVGLGNIQPDQVLAVEALRCRLRFDTLQNISEQLLRTGRWNPNLIEPQNHDSSN